MGVQSRRMTATGFTLIELLVVLSLVGIIAFVATPRFTATDLAQLDAVSRRLVADLTYARGLTLASGHGYACTTALTEGESPEASTQGYRVYRSDTGETATHPLTQAPWVIPFASDYPAVSFQTGFTLVFTASGSPDINQDLVLTTATATRTVAVTAAGLIELR